MNYPDAKRLDTVDVIHGREVADPYRWLEDSDDADTQAWSRAQDELAKPYLANLPGRDALADRIRDLLPGDVSVPALRGDRAFFLRREPAQEHGVFWLRDADGTERPLVDPNALSDDATITLDGATVSKEGDRVAYLLSQGGDEQSVLRVLDVNTGEIIDGPIDRTRYSPIGWLPGGEEFFYVRRLPPEQVPDGEEDFHRRVYRHRVGSDPDTDDVLVFGGGGDKTAFYDVYTSHDGRWLIISRALGTAPRNDVFIADLTTGVALSFTTIHEGEDVETIATIDPTSGLLHLLTNRDAPRKRLCVADPTSPTPDQWREVLPETDAVLDAVSETADHLVALRSRHAVSEVALHDKDTGALDRTIDLPSLGSAGIRTRPEGGHELWIGYTDFVTPARVLHYDPATDALEPWADPPGAIDVKGIVSEQITYQSKDGTDVRMFLIHQEGTTAGTPHPTILYGYGGFNIPLTPAYSASILSWVESGGVYVIANLRGGSEEGEAWHRAGMRDQKQNVFDDFIAAAEWLIAHGWTAPDQLAISGGSNGGLLVGATLTQRPDLFAAVICSAPLLDMVRYEQFGLGPLWTDEYGTVEDADEFGWLIGYSPYHRVTPGTAYPATLFTVFESDSRVDPNHARKMCAALQAASTASDRPILVRREVDVGHAGRSISRTVALLADQLSFLAAHTIPGARRVNT
jgi:prolyl oligopeptidase